MYDLTRHASRSEYYLGLRRHTVSENEQFKPIITYKVAYAVLCIVPYSCTHLRRSLFLGHRFDRQLATVLQPQAPTFRGLSATKYPPTTKREHPCPWWRRRASATAIKSASQAYAKLGGVNLLSKLQREEKKTQTEGTPELSRLDVGKDAL